MMTYRFKIKYCRDKKHHRTYNSLTDTGFTVMCDTCHYPKHPNWGKTQTPIQRLAAQRNWDARIVKGAIGQLLRVNSQRGGLLQQRLAEIEFLLLNNINIHWNNKKGEQNK